MAQLDLLKTILGITDTSQDVLLQIELDLAEGFIAEKRDTYDVTDPDNPVAYVESKYEMVQLMLASESFSKRGAEGESGHTESGIRRSYETGALYSEYTMAMIIPKVRVITIEDTEEE